MLEKLDLTSCASLTGGPIVRLIKERAMNGDLVVIGAFKSHRRVPFDRTRGAGLIGSQCSERKRRFV